MAIALAFTVVLGLVALCLGLWLSDPGVQNKKFGYGIFFLFISGILGILSAGILCEMLFK